MHGVFNQQECSWGPLRELELKTAMDVINACDPGKQVYVQMLDTLYQEGQSGHPPVLGLVYCCYSVPYDRMPFLGYSKLWWTTIKFEYKNHADAGAPFFLGLYNGKFYAVLKKERSRLYVDVAE